jgi:hypothetical protein
MLFETENPNIYLGQKGELHQIGFSIEPEDTLKIMWLVKTKITRLLQRVGQGFYWKYQHLVKACLALQESNERLLEHSDSQPVYLHEHKSF